jgi:hypothetical protein
VNVKRLNPDLAHFLKDFWGILARFSGLSLSLHLVMRQYRSTSNCVYRKLTDGQNSKLEFMKKFLAISAGYGTALTVARHGSVISVLHHESPPGLMLVNAVLEQNIMQRPPGCNFVHNLELCSRYRLDVLDNRTRRWAFFFIIVVLLEWSAIGLDLNLDTGIGVQNSHGAAVEDAGVCGDW